VEAPGRHLGRVVCISSVTGADALRRSRMMPPSLRALATNGPPIPEAGNTVDEPEYPLVIPVFGEQGCRSDLEGVS
jgi:hypothetical protein